MKKTAVILLNLGGPDSLISVKPFLFNLFYDKAIIPLINPLRWLIAKLISTRREKEAKTIYSEIGGKSPILENTNKQKEALEKYFKDNYKFFIAMRYWHPFSQEIIEEVKRFNPDEVILLPLYPHFSTTTSESSIVDFRKSMENIGLNIPIKAVCCFPSDKSFIKSHANLIKTYYEKAKKFGKPTILFSAHGLPQKVIDKGDPYQYQVSLTAKLIIEELNIKDLDWKISYQSKVGPVKWLEPNTEDEIKNLAKEKKPVVICPIAFVSDHSETLVELDIEYKSIYLNESLESYFRVEALGIDELFIQSLVNIINKFSNLNISESFYINSSENKRICPKEFCKCNVKEG